MRYVREPVALVVGALAVLLGIRIAVASWMWHDVLPAHRALFSQYLWIEALADIAFCLLVGGAIAWLVQRAVRVENERRRLEHFADVAVLSGDLAHEIRNHLNAFGTYISLLRRSVEPHGGELLQQVKKLEEVTADLDELLTEFLTFSRPLKDNLEEIDLAEVVRGVIEFLSLDLEQSRVDVRTETAPGVPTVLGDRGKLRRVILNLLVNARQAMPDGGTITIRLRRAGSRVQLDVEDTGCGIPPEEQRRVFDAFFSTKSEGTGLGLAIVRRTIEDMGGQIRLESQPGRGTTFYITLPSAIQHEPTTPRSQSQHPEKASRVA